VEFHDQLNALNHRLNVLVNESFDKETNPFAPGSFCKGFQDTLKTVALDSKALQVSYASFREVLSASLGEMYDNINKYLDDNGVKLNLKHQYKIKPSAESIPRPTPEAQKPAEKTSRNNLRFLRRLSLFLTIRRLMQRLGWSSPKR